MFDGLSHFAFISPGGPEFIVVMLALLIMFGAKDVPRILRKLNEIINQIRSTADGFKREVMYGDINNEPSSSGADYTDVEDHVFEPGDEDIPESAPEDADPEGGGGDAPKT